MKFYEGNNPYIFASYSHDNKDMVIPVLESLSDRGYRIWYDEGVCKGEEWRETVASHLVNSKCVLAFVSEEFNDSRHCKDEINLAHGKITIIPVYIDAMKTPEYLSDGMCMVLFGYNSIYAADYFSGGKIEALADKICTSSDLSECMYDTSETGKIHLEKIAKAIETYLKDDNWRFSYDEKNVSFRFDLSISSKIKRISYRISVHEDDYVVRATAPIGADEDDVKMMATMADFICRANYGLKNGNFELDMDDGEIKFKSFVDCEGIVPTSAIIRNSIYIPAAMFKRYSSGIVDIMFKGVSAKDAIRNCEGKSDD